MSTDTVLTYSEYLSNTENAGCVKLKDLLYHEDLESMVQINFMFDVEFLMSHLFDKTIPVTIIHGQTSQQIDTKKYPHTKAFKPVIKDRYGTHHSKAMLLFFRDKKTYIQSAQLIIMTANMIPQDWIMMTQGVYRTPKCVVKTNDSISSPFEREMLKYLLAYNLSCLLPIIKKFKLFDWSVCKAIIIGSVPGYHREKSISEWGLERLATVLRQHVRFPEACCKKSQLVLQCSSIASSPEKWFKENLCSSMSECMNNAKSVKPQICMVYPTLKTASESFTGREASGGFLRFEKDSYDKNHTWFDQYLYEWNSSKAGRQLLMPHIKTYTRLYNDEQGTPLVAWHLLTSANLSRAAWGEYQKNRTQMYIKSFELGVFFCPSLWEDENQPEVKMVPAMTTKSNYEKSATIEVRLPFDVPLTRHPKPLQCFTRLRDS